MTVYHGGYKAVERPEIRIGRNTKDFGNGFYCTVIKEQAQRCAKRYNTKIVSIYDVRGEIAEDLTYYFATSEQVPSSVGLGVLMEKNNTVRCAGGFIVQVMPFIEDEVLNKLEENIRNIQSVTSMLDNGHTPGGGIREPRRADLYRGPYPFWKGVLRAWQYRKIRGINGSRWLLVEFYFDISLSRALRMADELAALGYRGRAPGGW